MSSSQVWLRKNGGVWNGNVSADPATGVGGIALGSINQAFNIMGAATNQSITYNFGASAFSYPVPSGFTAGWSNAIAGFTTFDLATLTSGEFTGATLTNGNLTLNGGTFFGLVNTFSNDAKTSGPYYIEATYTTPGLFSTLTGGGVSRIGTDLIQFANSGRYSPDDPNGGVAFDEQPNTGSGHNVSVYANGITITSDMFQITGSDTISIAVDLIPTAAGGLTMSEFVATGYTTPYDDRNITLLYSDDGGASWNNGTQQSAGQQGKFLTAVQYRRLGESRLRVFKIRTAYPGPLTGVFVEYIVSNS